LVAVTAVAIAAAGVAAELMAGGAQPLRVAAADLVTGLALGCSGLVACTHDRRDAGIALLLASLLWFVLTAALSDVEVLRSLGGAVGLAYRGALVSGVVLVSCRPRAPIALAVVAAGWVASLASAAAQNAQTSIGLAIAIVLASLLIPARRPIGIRPIAALSLAVGMILPAAARLAGQTGDTGNRVLLTADLAFALAAVMVGILVIRDARADARLTERIVELSGDAGIESALATVLRDPSIRLLAPEAPRETLPGRERTVITDPLGGSIALVEHAAGALREPRLRSGAATAVLLQHEHDLRVASLRTAAEDLQAAQRRILIAADDARARLQRELERQVVPNADRLKARLDATPGLEAAADALDHAVQELRVLARGLHPPALERHGLRGALHALVDDAPLAVQLDVPGSRYSEETELVVYFACAEALTNAIKHASAMHIGVTVHEQDRLVIAEIADDGRGGASLSDGSGLAGLATRADALGGRIELISPAGAGTMVRIEVPA
jgi:signal transduction histidine kinase